jgi:hypothetical protein
MSGIIGMREWIEKFDDRKIVSWMNFFKRGISGGVERREERGHKVRGLHEYNARVFKDEFD